MLSCRYKLCFLLFSIHTSDETLMPKRRAAWSAWNYLGNSTEIASASSKGPAAKVKPVFVTYWLNQVR